VKLFLILVLHLRQFFIVRIFVKKATYHTVTTKTVPFLLGIVINFRSSSRTLTFQSSSQKRLGQLKSCYAVAFFTKILTIKNCRVCHTVRENALTMNCSLMFKSKRQYIVHLFFLFFSFTIKDKTKISLNNRKD
jgi:uncharacterized membrane protein